MVAGCRLYIAGCGLYVAGVGWKSQTRIPIKLGCKNFSE